MLNNVEKIVISLSSLLFLCIFGIVLNVTLHPEVELKSELWKLLLVFLIATPTLSSIIYFNREK